MSEQLGKNQIIFSSVIISIIVAFVICIIPHFDTSKYYYMLNSSGSGYYTGASSVLFATYECGFGERHKLNSNNLKVSDLYDKRTNNLIGDTFEHFLLLLIIAVVLTIIISAIWIRSEDQEKFKEIK